MRAVLRPAVHLAVETLALLTVVDPALAGTEGEAGDVLVRTVGRDLTVRTAGGVSQSRPPTLTLHLAALHPPGLTPTLGTAVPPLGPVTEHPALQSTVSGAGPAPLTLAPVTPGRVDTGGRHITGGRPRLALVQVPAGGGVLQGVVVGGVARPAGTVEPAHSVDTETLVPTPVDGLAQRTLVQVQLAVVAGVAGGTVALVRGHAEAAVMTGRLAESCE